MDLSAHGITVDVPPGWDGEIYRRRAESNAFSPQSEQSEPVLHLANFPLPGDRGDFGSGAVEVMRADNILIVLFEYGSESVGTVLFRSQGVPRVAPGDFAPHTMQRPLPGQSGAQYFFTEAGRAFCLYVALGAHGRRRQLVPEVNQVLSTLDVG
jgi:hypothetical protein